MNVLALCGSLRRESSHATLLRAAARLAPPGMSLHFDNSFGDLPGFNPDVELLGDAAAPSAVTAFRARLRAADGVVISTPEYAHGVPGALKNALDWVVGTGELLEKPVGLLSAQTQSSFAQDSLIETLTVMSVALIREACVSVPMAVRKLNEEGIVADPKLAAMLRGALRELAGAIGRRSDSSAGH